MYSKMIDQYLHDHKSNYQAKYVYHSCDREDTRTFKFHYYVRDRQLLQINVYLEIHLGDKVEVNFKEALHEYEQWAIACDALERIRAYTNRKTTVLPEQMESFVDEKKFKNTTSPQDLINALNYIMYHQGKNHDSIYEFYQIFIPYLKQRLLEGKYKEALLACRLLLDDILHETIWQGFNIKYLDQEHVLHQAYMLSILGAIHEYLIELFNHEKEQLIDLFVDIFRHWRFAFSVYSSLEKITIDYPTQMMDLLSEMNEACYELSLDGRCLVYDLIFTIATNDEKGHRQSVIEVMKLLLTDILSLANPEDQKQTGIIFLNTFGFEILLEIFEKTKDCYLYKCFPVKEIPEEFHPYIKKQLEDALAHYAKLMKDSTKRMEAIDQIATINTILIESFNVY